MGIYVNPGNSSYQMAVNSQIYVDKTGLLKYTNEIIGTEQRFICVSRPRRFGKSMAANMLAAYYSRGCDSAQLFAGRKIEEQNGIQKKYLDFMRGPFKGQEYVEMAYMTGILPIKKYGEHSVINIFDEYSMIAPAELAEFFGFTEEEVCALCDEKEADYDEIQKWYDGYLLNGLHIYNPKSVVDVLRKKKFKSYWTGTETYEALKVYIDKNFDGLKETIAMLLNNIHCKADPSTSQNDMTTFKTKDDILTLLVHLGYLAFDEAAEGAIKQIKEKEYTSWIKGYTGEILLVGVNYYLNP